MHTGLLYFILFAQCHANLKKIKQYRYGIFRIFLNRFLRNHTEFFLFIFIVSLTNKPIIKLFINYKRWVTRLTKKDQLEAVNFHSVIWSWTKWGSWILEALYHPADTIITSRSCLPDITYMTVDFSRIPGPHQMLQVSVTVHN